MTLERGRKKKLRADSNKLKYMLELSERPEAERLFNFVEHVEQEAMKPGAKANVMELYANLKGLLVKKQEVKHQFELSADEHFRIRENARQRISGVLGTANGDRSLLPEHRIHVEEIREDKGQTGGGNSVDSVATST